MKKSATIFYMSFIFLSCLGLSSCKKDNSKTIQINSVWSNEINVESKQIHAAYFNSWIRLHGEGLTGLQKIYFNGTDIPFNPNYVTDNDILVKVPGIATGVAVQDQQQLNTVRILTLNGEAIYHDFIFKDPNKIPSVASVSNTMPYPGEVIEVSGGNLDNVTKVYFPGNIEAEIKSVTSKIVKVGVPNNVDRNLSGAMKVVADGDEFLSPPYMFYQKGIFLKTFTEDVMSVNGSANIKIYSTPSSISTITNLSINPDVILAIPEVSKNVAVSSAWTGYFKYNPSAALQKIINDPSSGITGSSSLQNLAFQFDLYMNQSWSSGYISFCINKNAGATTAAYRYNIYSSATTASFDFNGGWKTITVPFGNFKSLALGSLADYIGVITSNNYEALIGFSNYNPENDGHTAKALSNFQMFIANVRIVRTK
ncbi:MAG: glycan-binding surface protein [Candidatus Pedobacter colombiensis]|uniref:Glycan-binding surface protein n=1 Tax=Candidatus Pedobacter colombiensis TaxID=3121371 RepID=A0AAJ5W617_9SPHI|nr:glycan-binding surface protein [Pedobacter sp.]WEK17773.1 MAG: glycan-binding surface protein [Pedobacter sp.]